MADDGSVKVELLVDIPNDRIKDIVDQFKELGFTVETAQQASGLWSLAAAKVE